MAGDRKFSGEGEVFVDDASLGRASYLLYDTSTGHAKSAAGTLEFDDGVPRPTPTKPLTVRRDSRASFQVVVTRIENGQMLVASTGPIPGL